MVRFTKIREYENLHILLWLIKDTCWVLLWKIPGLIMIVPTLLVAVHIAFISRRNQADLYHNLAICMWITANSVWMIGEFFFNDTFRPFAMVFFIAGLLSVGYYYLILGPKTNKSSK